MESMSITRDVAVRVRDIVDAGLAEAVVQVLLEMRAPGCAYLDLVPLETL